MVYVAYKMVHPLKKEMIITIGFNNSNIVKNMSIEYAWFSILISCICAAIISSIWLIFELRKLKIP